MSSVLRATTSRRGRATVANDTSAALEGFNVGVLGAGSRGIVAWTNTSMLAALAAVTSIVA